MAQVGKEIRWFARAVLVLSLAFVPFATEVTAQRYGRITSRSDTADVIDHRRFDSAWRASVRFGRLATTAIRSDAVRQYMEALATAEPMAFLPPARRAFWTNAWMACLWHVVDLHAGYRSTLWDSTLFVRDTFVVAGEPHTLATLRTRLIQEWGTALACVWLATGSTHAPPLPSGALRARIAERSLREQLRRVVRSERLVLWDPAGDVLQCSSFFQPWMAAIEREHGSLVAALMPSMTEAMAAAIALRRPYVRIVVSDRIERWLRRR